MELALVQNQSSNEAQELQITVKTFLQNTSLALRNTMKSWIDGVHNDVNKSAGLNN